MHNLARVREEALITDHRPTSPARVARFYQTGETFRARETWIRRGPLHVIGTRDARGAPRRSQAVGLEPNPMPTNTSSRKRSPGGPRPPWRQVVRCALSDLGGEASLQALYARIEQSSPSSWLPTHWKAKIRQQVQLDPEVERVAEGVWRLVSSDDAS